MMTVMTMMNEAEGWPRFCLFLSNIDIHTIERLQPNEGRNILILTILNTLNPVSMPASSFFHLLVELPSYLQRLLSG